MTEEEQSLLNAEEEASQAETPQEVGDQEAWEAQEDMAVSKVIQAEAARQAAQALVAAQLIEEAALEEAARVVTGALAVEAAGSEG
jgi:hypothetical protein